MTKELKKEVFKNLALCSYSNASNNSQKSFAMREDVRTLAESMIKYFDLFYPNLIYKDFYDKPFLDVMKYIIKNELIFYHFLEYVNYRDVIRDFFATVVYICPQVFTSAVNRFIREHYNLSESETK